MNVPEDRRWVVDRRVLGYLHTRPDRDVTPRELAARCNITLEEARLALERLNRRYPSRLAERPDIGRV